MKKKSNLMFGPTERNENRLIAWCAASCPALLPDTEDVENHLRLYQALRLSLQFSPTHSHTSQAHTVTPAIRYANAAISGSRIQIWLQPALLLAYLTPQCSQ